MEKSKFYILLIVFISLSAFKFYKVTLSYPKYFPKPQYDFSQNPLSAEKIELGRMLFYDTRLSKDLTISCASCHSSFNAFAHTDHNLSHGINDAIGNRNAPGIFNLAWQKTFMWDGAVHHLDMQPLAPLSHPKEMGTSINEVADKLSANATYKALFYEAFGDSLISGAHILKALAQFQLTLVSANSKYDKYKRGELAISKKELAGYEVFKTNCNSCHTEPLFSSYAFKNNGLPVDSILLDYGRYNITRLSKDSLLFKVPSLRNLSFTYPYMHDGRYRYLKEVLAHYSNIDTTNPLLSEALKKTEPLSANDKINLTAFLLTLNDTSFVFNKAFQYPKALYEVPANSNLKP